jgi:hypothetical protein
MLQSVAAHGLAELPDDGDSPHRQASQRGERVSPRRTPTPTLSSYLTAMTIAAGLVFAWAGLCWI